MARQTVRRERTTEQQNLDELEQLIVEHPQRSLAIAGVAGFALGGGLSSRTIFRFVLIAIEAVIGNRLVPAIVSGVESNGHRRSHNKK